MNAPFDVKSELRYLETIGRVSEQPCETEIWFAWEDGTIYLLSGGGISKDWIRNFQKTPEVRFRVGETWVTGRARIVEDPELDRRIRRVVAGKYFGFDPDSDAPLPNDWSRTAVPGAIPIDPGG